MDTGSHLLFGASIAGLALMDPAVAHSSSMIYAVAAGTLIGSHAPDFDTLTRLKSFSSYVRYHRGISHSLPAMLVWPLLFALPLGFLFHVMPQFMHLYFWITLAVVFHVSLDLFNAYGVQCFRPFSSRWYHLDTLALFEPFLGALHIAGWIVWLSSSWSAQTVFGSVFVLTLLYIGIRYVQHLWIRRFVQQQLGMLGSCKLLPGLHWFKWQFLLATEDAYYTGMVQYRKVRVLEQFAREQQHHIIDASRSTDGVQAFLQFAQNVHVSFHEREDGYDVQWRDLRFWHNHKLPFGADVSLDRELNVVSDKVGWNKKYWDPPFV